MRRRSVSLYPVMESIIRGFQADLLLRLNRDVTFNEALNLYILGGAMAKGADQLKGLPVETLTMFLDRPEHLDAVLDDVITQGTKAALEAKLKAAK